MNQGCLIVVLGPTGVGKTALCIQLAQALNTEIISADARQCYQEISIGTAKPTMEELAAVKHHLVDFLPLDQPYSAGAFAKDALTILEQLFQHHQWVILTGGSGLYIKALCEGFDDMPPVDQSLRDQLNLQLKNEELASLVDLLRSHDPQYAEEVDLNNPQRVIRALEVCLTTGQSYSSIRKNNPKERPFKVIKVGLERDRAELYQRINQRVDQMIEVGLWEEAAKLYSRRELPALKTVGYQEVFDAISGQTNRETAIEMIKQNSRRYAKRQMTWFKKDTSIHWFHPEDLTGIQEYIASTT